MVKRNSTRTPGTPRETIQDQDKPGGDGCPTGAATAPAFCERALEAGRGQLEKTRVILECMAFTLAYRREATDREIQLEASDFGLMAEIARDLLLDFMRKLDSATFARATAEEASC